MSMLRCALVLIMSLCLAAPALALHTSAGPLPLSALGYKPYSGPVGPLLLTTPPQVGDERVFWAWDLNAMPPADKQVTATCRGVGDTIYVFVENERWGVEMDQDDVDAILEAMDDSTPAGSLDPESGIVDIEVQAFGPLPDELDDDPRVYLLYYDIGSYGGYSFDGYFNADNQTTGPKSNQVEMLFLNTQNQSVSSDYMLAVAGHELNHLLQWGADAAESVWLSESFAELAMLLCGYYTDEALVEDFAAEPAIPLIPGEDEQVDYGATLLFGLYMYERLGADFVADLFADAADGRTSIEDALYELGNDPTFERLFLDWSVANLIDAESEPWAELYGYATIDTPEFARLEQVEQLPASVDLQLNGWSANYIDVAVTGLPGLRARVVSGKASDLGLALISYDGGVQDPPEQVLASDGDELIIGVPSGGDEISVVVTLPENAPPDAGYVLELEEAAAPADDDDDAGDDDDDDGGCCG